MSDGKTTAPFDIESFARLHGLDRLSLDQLARMAELAPKMAHLGRGIPRLAEKSIAPAERGRLLKSAS